MNATFPAGLIRPWYPGRVSGGVFTGHLSPDCEDLLRDRPEPQEGAGWLDPRDGNTCKGCIHDHDPKLYAAIFGDDEDDE